MIKHRSGCDWDKYSDEFDQMFRQRKLVFHDQKKWDVQIVNGEFERDEYDRDDTEYLMAFDRGGRLVGSMRMLSTLTPHMMSGPFRPMFPDFRFTSPNIWEVTRFVVHGDRSVQPNMVSTAACELLLEACKFGLDNGIRHMTSVYDACMLRLYKRCGLPNPEFARYRTENHGTVFVGVWELTDELLSSIEFHTGLGDHAQEPNIARAA